MKISLFGAELFHTNIGMEVRTDGHADMPKLIVTFRSFANAPQNLQKYPLHIMCYCCNLLQFSEF